MPSTSLFHYKHTYNLTIYHIFPFQRPKSMSWNRCGVYLNSDLKSQHARSREKKKVQWKHLTIKPWGVGHP